MYGCHRVLRACVLAASFLPHCTLGKLSGNNSTIANDTDQLNYSFGGFIADRQLQGIDLPAAAFQANLFVGLLYTAGRGTQYAANLEQLNAQQFRALL